MQINICSLNFDIQLVCVVNFFHDAFHTIHNEYLSSVKYLLQLSVGQGFTVVKMAANTLVTKAYFKENAANRLKLRSTQVGQLPLMRGSQKVPSGWQMILAVVGA